MREMIPSILLRTGVGARTHDETIEITNKIPSPPHIKGGWYRFWRFWMGPLSVCISITTGKMISECFGMIITNPFPVVVVRFTGRGSSTREVNNFQLNITKWNNVLLLSFEGVSRIDVFIVVGCCNFPWTAGERVYTFWSLIMVLHHHCFEFYKLVYLRNFPKNKGLGRKHDF